MHAWIGGGRDVGFMYTRAGVIIIYVCFKGSEGAEGCISMETTLVRSEPNTAVMVSYRPPPGARPTK